jgi:tetratricopeptide (TPR) repeat protein
MNQREPSAAVERARTIAENSPDAEPAAAAAQPSVPELLGAGLEHHRVGHLADAEIHYRRVLAAMPGQGDALHLLGMIAYQSAHPEMAIELIDQAIMRNGDIPSYHVGRGLALRSLGRLDDALQSYDRALTIEPDNAEALNNRGLLLHELQRFDGALESYDRALAVRSDFAQALNNRGNTLQALERLEEAVASYDRALALEPDLTEAYFNRGEALRDLQQSQLPSEERNRPQFARPDSSGRQVAIQQVPPRSPAVDPRTLLDSMYRNEPQLGSDGQFHALDFLDARIWPEEGALLVQLYTELKPQQTVEIGLGYGFSTVFFMMAMQQSEGGHHIAIDPFQHVWQGIGATRAAVLQMQDRFTLIEKESAVGLPLLAAGGLQAQLIFIDGNHRFDNVLVDFFLADAICSPEGIIVFDDMWMPAIQKVARFITNNRSDYRYRATNVKNAAVFSKVARDERPWNHYVDF